MIELVGNLTYVLIAASYWTRDIVWLRAITIPACLCGILFGLFLEGGPVWVIIGWNLVFLAINAYQLGEIYIRRRRLTANPDMNLLRELLAPLSDDETSQLVSCGKFFTTHESQVVLRENQYADGLYLILQGYASVWQDERLLVICPAGTFLGDISFATQRPCTATVRLNPTTRVIFWPIKELETILDSNAGLKANLSMRLARDISSKLIRNETAFACALN